MDFNKNFDQISIKACLFRIRLEKSSIFGNFCKKAAFLCFREMHTIYLICIIHIFYLCYIYFLQVWLIFNPNIFLSIKLITTTVIQRKKMYAKSKQNAQGAMCSFFNSFPLSDAMWPFFLSLRWVNDDDRNFQPIGRGFI